MPMPPNLAAEFPEMRRIRLGIAPDWSSSDDFVLTPQEQLEAARNHLARERKIDRVAASLADIMSMEMARRAARVAVREMGRDDE